MPSRDPVFDRLGKHAARITLTLVLGGLLGATLVRRAPGFGVDEAELDARLPGRFSTTRSRAVRNPISRDRAPAAQ